MADCIIPEGYKKTSLGVVPEEWEVKRLGDLLSRCANGLTYDVSMTHGISVTRIETISTGKINYQKVGYIPNEIGYENFKMEQGDILYSHINSLSQIGKVAYYNSDKKLYHGMNLLLLRANMYVSQQYLYYVLLTEYMRHMAQIIAKPAVNQASISTGDLKKIRILVPPLEEQQKISEVLSVWDKAIEKQMQLIEKLELRKKGLMQQLLTGKKRLPGFSGEWKKVKFSSIIEKMSNGYVYDTNNTGDIPITRIETISKGNIDYSKVGFIQYAGELEKYKLRKGDILFSHINSIAHIGKVAMFDGNKDLYHGMNLLLIRAKEIINKNYLYYFLSSTIARRKVRSIAKQAVNQASVNTDELKKWILCIPEIEEQNAIAQILAETDQEIKFGQEKLELLRQQKRGLMQQLLTGKKRIKF